MVIIVRIMRIERKRCHVPHRPRHRCGHWRPPFWRLWACGVDEEAWFLEESIIHFYVTTSLKRPHFQNWCSQPRLRLNNSGNWWPQSIFSALFGKVMMKAHWDWRIACHDIHAILNITNVWGPLFFSLRRAAHVYVTHPKQLFFFAVFFLSDFFFHNFSFLCSFMFCFFQGKGNFLDVKLTLIDECPLTIDTLFISLALCSDLEKKRPGSLLLLPYIAGFYIVFELILIRTVFALISFIRDGCRWICYSFKGVERLFEFSKCSFRTML